MIGVASAKLTQRRARTHTVKVRALGGFYVDGRTVKLYGKGGSCDCILGRHAIGGWVSCSHVIAALDFAAREDNYVVSVWGDERHAKRQHKRKADIGDGATVTMARRNLRNVYG